MGFFCAISCLAAPLYGNTLIPHEKTSVQHRPLMSDAAILFSGNANLPLAEEVARCLGVSLGKAKVGKFNDGEIEVHVEQSVRNKEIYILQSTCPSKHQSINDNLMELILLVRTMKRASASSITAVIPYYGYARQDRKTSPRVPISAADVALLLEKAGVDRVITIDLHCGQIQGFFHDAPVDNLAASGLFIPYFVKKGLQNVVVVSPDAGGVGRAKNFMEKLTREGVSSQMAMISKQRAGAAVIDSMKLIGEVEGSDVILVDDLCDTAGTLVKAAQLLKDKGARRVFAAITHPVFSGSALTRIGESVIEEMVTTNTIPLRENAPSNIHTISCAPLIADTILRIHDGQSVSDLFK